MPQAERWQKHEGHNGGAREAVAGDPAEQPGRVGVVGHEEGETGPEPKHLAHGRVLGVDVVARAFSAWKLSQLPQAATTTESMAVPVPLGRESLRGLARAKNRFFGCYKLVGVLDAGKRRSQQSSSSAIRPFLIYAAVRPKRRVKADQSSWAKIS